MGSRRSFAVAVLVVLLGTSACSHDKKKAAPDTTTTSAVVTSTQPASGTTTSAPGPASSPPASGSTTTRQPATTTTVSGTSTSAPSTTTATGITTTTLVAKQGASSPALAAQGLVAAWQARDRSGAAAYGAPAAVRSLFQMPKEPAKPLGPCQPDGAMFSCPYSTKSGGVFFLRVEGSRSAGYRVAELTTATD